MKGSVLTKLVSSRRYFIVFSAPSASPANPGGKDAQATSVYTALQATNIMLMDDELKVSVWVIEKGGKKSLIHGAACKYILLVIPVSPSCT